MRSLLCCLVLVLVFVATGRAQLMPPRDCIKTGDNCRENCVSPTRYQWCGDCVHYLDCTSGNANYPLCQAGLVWNDNAGVCAPTSPTCTQCIEPAAKCLSTGPNCLNDCLGQLNGVYQWCGRCDYFLQCSGGATTITKCQSNTLFYDDNVKACVAASSTCDHSPCLIPLPACTSNPCVNGGTCHEPGNDTYWCECLYGYYGQRCEYISTCISNPCQNGGTCNGDSASYVCTCPPGFSGLNCESLPVCSSNPCQNGGTCNGDFDSYVCSCPPGFTGINCESQLACSSNPCQNGGTCNGDFDSYVCSCPPGFIGSNCETASSCPPGFTETPNHFCYLFNPQQTASWSDADAWCRAAYPGAYMVAISSATEQSDMENFLRGFSVSQCPRYSDGLTAIWTSGYATQGCENFAWQPFPGVFIPMTYTNWDSGEPNCYDNLEPCVELNYPSYRWNDNECQRLYCFLCEYATTPGRKIKF